MNKVSSILVIHACMNTKIVFWSDVCTVYRTSSKLKNTAACCQTSLTLVQLAQQATIPTVRPSCLLILLSKSFCFQVDMMDDEELLELVELETREMTGAQYTWFFLWLDHQWSKIIHLQSVSSPQLGHTDNHWRRMTRLSQYGFPGDDTPFIQGFPYHVKDRWTLSLFVQILKPFHGVLFAHLLQDLPCKPWKQWRAIQEPRRARGSAKCQTVYIVLYSVYILLVDYISFCAQPS